MKIAIMYICTGKYEKFWDDFYCSSEEFFYPDAEKNYYVFTDSMRISSQTHSNVKYYYQAKVGWPYDTLLRFHWFAMLQDQILKNDFCYFCNANALFLRKITPELIPLPTEDKPLIFWCHTAHYNDYNSNDITTEKNPESTAYVEADTECRAFGGGFFGGTGTAFLKMTLDLRDNIQTDLTKGIIAVWHDQSHIISYAAKNIHMEVGKDLICEEARNPVKGVCAMIYRDKEKNGGIDNLRENGLAPRIRHKIIGCYHAALKTNILGTGKLFRKIAGMFPNRRNWYR